MNEAPIEDVRALAFTIPTDAHESDGTLEWDSTTIVVAEADAGGKRGLGYSYTDSAAAPLIVSVLADAVRGRDAMDVPASWSSMVCRTRNLGRAGIVASAIGAVDSALWDLKGRLLDLSVVDLLGATRPAVTAYGSGGFTSYPTDQLCGQLRGWIEQGLSAVKMKVGREPDRDRERVRAARAAIGDRAALFVDANGAYTRKQALELGQAFAACGVSWFEEPVSSDDLVGLRLLRDRGPGGMAIAAGEYGYDPVYFRRMLEAGAVDVLQADATRCAGITGFLTVGALCEAHGVPLSAHTAPSLHAHPACAVQRMYNVEYFHDHVRIEQLLFDGALAAIHGKLRPDRTTPGLGLELKRADARRFCVWGQ